MNNNVFFPSCLDMGVEVKSQKREAAVWPKPGRALDKLEGHDTHRHEERKKWCRARAGNEPRIYRSPSGGCGCCCCSRIFRRRASTTGFSYWVFLFIWLSQRERKQHNKGKDWLEKKKNKWQHINVKVQPQIRRRREKIRKRVFNLEKTCFSLGSDVTTRWLTYST